MEVLRWSTNFEKWALVLVSQSTFAGFRNRSKGARWCTTSASRQVNRGSIYGFLVPNGSGKTTTIRMLCGLLTPDSGEGRCLGYDIRHDADKVKRRVGYMKQRF